MAESQEQLNGQTNEQQEEYSPDKDQLKNLEDSAG